MANANASRAAASGSPAGAAQPYIPAHVSMPEFTPRAVIVGTLLGIVFGASSL